MTWSLDKRVQCRARYQDMAMGGDSERCGTMTKSPTGLCAKHRNEEVRELRRNIRIWRSRIADATTELNGLGESF